MRVVQHKPWDTMKLHKQAILVLSTEYSSSKAFIELGIPNTVSLYICEAKDFVITQKLEQLGNRHNITQWTYQNTPFHHVWKNLTYTIGIQFSIICQIGSHLVLLSNKLTLPGIVECKMFVPWELVVGCFSRKVSYLNQQWVEVCQW